MSATFTPAGSAELERHLSDTCDLVRKGVLSIIPAHKLQGLVLAGGYGRGEGGVLRRESGDAPYNDLEFFVFIRGVTAWNDYRYRHALHDLGEELSQFAGIEVEFKILSLAKLRRSTPTMFYYDLVMGHRWLVGDDRLLAGCDHHRDESAIPLHEATRLLFNRCSGLLYAKERLQRPVFTDADADFVARNIAKAKLALGDVWLAMHGSYHWSCNERLQRLKGFKHKWARQLEPHHEEGVAFKLYPKSAHAEERESLTHQHAQIGELAEALWLHLEGRRIRRPFRSAREYARTTQPLCPERSTIRNGVINLRAMGLRGLVSKFRSRYPRERLLRALSLLLWGKTNEEETAIIHACLNCKTDSFPSAVRAYEKLWHHFN